MPEPTEIANRTPVNETLVRDLAGGGFLEQQRNVVLTGGTGTGKPVLSSAHAKRREQHIVRIWSASNATGRPLSRPYVASTPLPHPTSSDGPISSSGKSLRLRRSNVTRNVSVVTKVCGAPGRGDRGPLAIRSL